MAAADLVCVGDRLGNTVSLRGARSRSSCITHLCAARCSLAAKAQPPTAVRAPNTAQPTPQDEHTPGPGTYARGGFIYASVVGVRQEAAAPEGGRAALEVASRASQPVVPEPGLVVTAKVSQVRVCSSCR